MPCYQQRTTAVEINVANLDVMQKALDALGYATRRDGETIRVTHKATGRSGYFLNGRLVLTGAGAIDVNQLKREYSRQTIVTTAKRLGWQLRFKESGDIEAVRRRFA